MRALSGFEVLVIEDAVEQAKQIRRVLEADGAAVSEARTARSALAAADEICPHLILCDLGLIGLGGFNFLSEAKKNAMLARIPVLALSHPRDRQGIVRARQLGAADCLLKPLGAQMLLQKVERLLAAASFGKRSFDAGARPPASVTVPMEIVRADEGGLRVLAPVALGPEADVRIESPMLDQLGLSGTLTRSGNQEGSQPARDGGYVSEINLLGVDSRTARTIREFLRGRKATERGSSS